MKTALRSCGRAMRVKVPKAARTEAPRPNPATTVPAAESRAWLWVTPASETRVPRPSRADAGASSPDAGRERSREIASAPEPTSSVTTTPPIRWLCRPRSWAATDGPRERYIPASAQPAFMAGITGTMSARRWEGMATFGRGEARAPGRRCEVSGIRVTNSAARTMPANSIP
ncbi:hypothetical protein ABZY14_25115 [Streptomyces sp. NPDC006617]|uniref:hypothetical protein n=1 Tax=Streptomyces sp. NPDC006617 TaxID=3155354 RepID=UPI0033A659F2